MASVNEGKSDAPASIETTYVMSVGDTFDGVLDHKFDEDWIRIELEKGKTYRISLSGRGKGGDEAEDTILKLYDSTGKHIATNDDVDTGEKPANSELIFTAPAEGVYYISAGSYTGNPNQDNSGAYTITVVEDIQPDTDTPVDDDNDGGLLDGLVVVGGTTFNDEEGDDYLFFGGPGSDDTLDDDVIYTSTPDDILLADPGDPPPGDIFIS